MSVNKLCQQLKKGQSRLIATSLFPQVLMQCLQRQRGLESLHFSMLAFNTRTLFLVMHEMKKQCFSEQELPRGFKKL